MVIYKTTNLVNGKIYVGKDAFNNPKYLGSGLILERAVKKYGPDSFKKEVLEICNSPEELDRREIFWIKELNTTSRNVGYNIANGGIGGDTYSNQSEDKKKAIREKRAESSREIFASAEFKQKHSELSKKMWQNPTHRKIMHDALTGREITWKDKIGATNKKVWAERGDIRSEETKKRMAELLRRRMTGIEMKPVSVEIGRRIVELYNTIGPKLIANTLQSEGHDVSRFLVVRFLKKAGIYQKWQKGIGETAQKHASISRCGSGNPMFKHSR